MHAIATVSIGGNLEDKIEAIAAAGYDGLEIFENDLRITSYNVCYTKLLR